MPYAVIDFETTGILPALHHRAVEIGITHVDDGGAITDRFETLLNPERDLGPQRIHGITAAEVLDAPTFADVAPDIANLLRGRTVVAHNAPFDERFLRAEFALAGFPLPDGLPTVCTMRLASRFGLGGSCSLSLVCECFGLENPHAHSAGADAFATAELLEAYITASRSLDGWGEYWAQTGSAAQYYPYPNAAPTGVIWKRRGGQAFTPPHFLERISRSAARDTAPGAEADYLAMLDRCLLDRLISVSEGDHLATLASDLGLDRAAAERLHDAYYADLVREAWADGILTDAERTDLTAVADLLRLPDDRRSTDAPVGTVTARRTGMLVDHFALAPGAMIVLTGEMLRPRDDWEHELRTHGLVPHPAVTKKVALVVAADPDSLSGKARKARDYGIPIVSEEGLAAMLREVTAG